MAADEYVEDKGEFAVGRKWGELISPKGGFRGFQAVPDLLFRHQNTLGITNTEMVVLLNILMHWWRAEDMPHPTVNVIARRMGTTERSVQRALAGLKRKELIADLKANQAGEGRERYFRKFDVSLLKKALRFAEFGTEQNFGEQDPNGTMSAPMLIDAPLRPRMESTQGEEEDQKK